MAVWCGWLGGGVSTLALLALQGEPFLVGGAGGQHARARHWLPPPHVPHSAADRASLSRPAAPPQLAAAQPGGQLRRWVLVLVGGCGCGGRGACDAPPRPRGAPCSCAPLLMAPMHLRPSRCLPAADVGAANVALCMNKVGACVWCVVDMRVRVGAGRVCRLGPRSALHPCTALTRLPCSRTPTALTRLACRTASACPTPPCPQDDLSTYSSATLPFLRAAESLYQVGACMGGCVWVDACIETQRNA